MWIGFFRKHAEYITRCNECLARARRPDAGGKKERMRKTGRVRDLSSDEDDTLAVTFDPLVISRSSPVGIVLQKWLSASRRRLGGIFPRPKAAKEMQAYTRRMKRKAAARRRENKVRVGCGVCAVISGDLLTHLRFCDGRPQDAGHDADGGLVMAAKLPLSAATVAIGKLWLGRARTRIVEAMRSETHDMYGRLRDIMQHLTPDEDWYFGSDVRRRGEELLANGKSLLEERVGLEDEERTRIAKVQREFDDYAQNKGECGQGFGEQHGEGDGGEETRTHVLFLQGNCWSKSGKCWKSASLRNAARSLRKSPCVSTRCGRRASSASCKCASSSGRAFRCPPRTKPASAKRPKRAARVSVDAAGVMCVCVCVPVSHVVVNGQAAKWTRTTWWSSRRMCGRSWSR